MPEGPGEPAEQGQAHLPEWMGTSREDCERMVAHNWQWNATVRFMVERMAEAGCSVDEGFVRVERCSAAVGGGFTPGEGVIICHNHLATRGDVGNAMVHELIHAYDQCRARDLDWADCKQHACSEVRAASLSGDCRWKQELFRGNLGLRGQHQKCVRRRAEISVAMNPHCSKLRAKAAVQDCFEACFADTAPFDRIP